MLSRYTNPVYTYLPISYLSVENFNLLTFRKNLKYILIVTSVNVAINNIG